MHQYYNVRARKTVQNTVCRTIELNSIYSFLSFPDRFTEAEMQMIVKPKKVPTRPQLSAHLPTLGTGEVDGEDHREAQYGFRLRKGTVSEWVILIRRRNSKGHKAPTQNVILLKTESQAIKAKKTKVKRSAKSKQNLNIKTVRGSQLPPETLIY